jgi:hypothetical protein
MNVWDLAVMVLIGVAATVYLVYYVRKELSAKKDCREKDVNACGSFCNACGKKQCPIEKAELCSFFPDPEAKKEKKHPEH